MLEIKLARFLITLKDAPQKMQFRCKNWQIWFRGAKMQDGGKFTHNRLSPAQNV